MGWFEVQVSLDVVDDNDIVQLRSTSSSVLFSGFLEVFKVRSSNFGNLQSISFFESANKEGDSIESPMTYVLEFSPETLPSSAKRSVQCLYDGWRLIRI